MSPATAVRVRVSVPDVWDTVEVSVDPSATVADVKATALQAATGRHADEGDYEVKFRGALVSDERRTLAELGVRDGSAIIVLPVRRRPVR